MTADLALPAFDLSAVLPAFALPAIALVLTYAAHSTLLLSAAWLAICAARLRSHALREWLWKSAAVLPLITTPLALLGGWPQPLLELTLGENTTVAGSLLPRAKQPPAVDGEQPAGKMLKTPKTPGPAEATSHVAAEAVRDDTAADVRVNDNAADASTADHAVRADVAVAPPPDDASGQDLLESGFGMELQSPASADAETEETAEFAEAAANPDQREQGESSKAEAAPTASDVASAKWPTIAKPSPSAASNSSTIAPVSLSLRSIAAWMLRVAAAVCCAVLCGGAVVCLLRYARLVTHFRRTIALDGGPARSALDRLCRRARLRRRVRLLACPRTRQPLAFGVGRWTIVLPEGLQERLPRRELEALLAHELAHLARGDVLWLWLGQALCTCLAFQPLNFLARRGWQDAAEYQCDDWALAHGVAPLELARCLAEVAEWRLDARPVAGLTATGSPSQVGKRIRRLAEGRPAPDRWNALRGRITLAAASLTAAALIAGWAPRAAWSLPAAKDDTVVPAQDRDVERSDIEFATLVPDEADDLAASADESFDDDPLPNDESHPADNANAGEEVFEAVESPDDDLAAEWQQLNRELRELNDAVRRLAAALAENAGDPQLATAAEQLRRRAEELEARRIRLLLRVGTDAASPDE